MNRLQDRKKASNRKKNQELGTTMLVIVTEEVEKKIPNVGSLRRNTKENFWKFWRWGRKTMEEGKNPRLISR